MKDLTSKAIPHDPAVFGVLICDPHYPDQVKNMIQGLLEKNIKGLSMLVLRSLLLFIRNYLGIVIGGAHLGMKVESRTELVEKIHSVNREVAVMTQGADSFEEVSNSQPQLSTSELTTPFLFNKILKDLEIGVDLIHSNYPLRLTKAGCAFNPAEAVKVEASECPLVSLPPSSHAIHLEPTQTPEEPVNNENNQDDAPSKGKRKREETHNKPQKRSRREQTNDEGEEAAGPIVHDSTPFDSFSLNLWDEKYRKDRGPILAGCACHACRHHTRAYIHHLLKSNELTADVLLYQHNQFQLMRTFQEAQKQIHEAGGNFHNWKSSLLK